MGVAAAEAAVYDTSPSLLRNPPPIPAGTARPSALDMILQAMEANTKRMENNLDEMNDEFRSDIRAWGKEMRGEMRQVGQCLQADTMAPPRAATSELKGSAPAGEDRVIRETCRVTEEAKVTVTRRKKLNGVTETCTARREVTELTKTRETVEERLHGVEEKDGVKDAHTHTLVVRDNGGELAERVETRCEQLGSLPREQGEGVCPLEAGHGQGNSVVPREVEGVSAADGCAWSLGGMKAPELLWRRVSRA